VSRHREKIQTVIGDRLRHSVIRARTNADDAEPSYRGDDEERYWKLLWNMSRRP
jgi:hypothetical protein